MQEYLHEKVLEARAEYSRTPSQLSTKTKDVDDIDTVAERRKLDFTLLPLFTLLFATNFVDRISIENAKIAGLEADLGLKGFDYNIALTLFYVSYIAVEIPCNLAMKYLGSIWLAFLIIVFGVVSITTALIHNFSGLIATRVFLGIAESGLLPGLVYLLSRYYRRKELVLRVGIFFGISSPLAGAFGGLLASGLLTIDPIGSVKSWRKIFLVEGIITTGIGIICMFIIPADPEHSLFLTEKERVLALKRIAADRVVKNSQREKTKMELVFRAFNINTFICSLAFLLANITFQGLSLFMPTVVATLGHFTTVESQLRTVPPYLVGALWSVTASYVSLRVRNRGWCIFISSLLCVAGYAIFVGSKNSHARYGACFLAISGASGIGPILLAWVADNSAPETVRAVATALIPGIGQIGSIIAVWTYLPDDAPDYHRGNSLNLAACSFTCVLGLIGVQYAHWENQKRERGERDHRLFGKSEEEIEELGSRHPAYRYQP